MVILLRRENGHVLRREDGDVLRKVDSYVLRMENTQVLRRVLVFDVEGGSLKKKAQR